MFSWEKVKLPLILFPSPYTKNIVKAFKENPNYPLFRKPYGPIATYLWSYTLFYVKSGGSTKSFDAKVGAMMHDLVFGHVKRIDDPKVLRFIEELGKTLAKKYGNTSIPYVIDTETIFEVKRKLDGELIKKKEKRRKKRSILEKLKNIALML